MNSIGKGGFREHPQNINPNGRPTLLEYGQVKYSERRRHYKLVTQYGITLEEYNSLFEKQDGVCIICGKPETKKQTHGKKGNPKVLDSLSVDHDHKTGRIRGLLCYKCNYGIGLFGEDVELFRKIVDYLEINKVLSESTREQEETS